MIIHRDPPTDPRPPLSCSEICMTLPSKNTAEILCNHYVKNLNWINHIIHAPHTRRQLLGIYASLEAGRKPTSPNVALVATILAIAVYFRTNLPAAAPLREEEKGSCVKWNLLAQRALLEANHLTSPSPGSSQTTITGDNSCQIMDKTLGSQQHLHVLPTCYNFKKLAPFVTASCGRRLDMLLWN